MSPRLRPLDLVELRGFCLAVELGSLGRAASAMAISQPALSKRMRELELFAGGPLLERSPRGVRPTTSGERLYREARALLTRADHVERVLDGLRGARTPVRLAASHTIAEYLLPEPLSEYRERLGHGFALELVAANSSVVRDLVREGRADVGLAAATAGEALDQALTSVELADDEVMVAVAAGHPWAHSHVVSLQEFLATPMVMRDPSANTRQVVDAALRARGLEMAPPLAEVGSTGAALAAAVSGRAAAVLSERAIRAGEVGGGLLVGRRVEGLDLRRRFVLIGRAGEEPTEQMRDLTDYLRSQIPNQRLSLSASAEG